MRCNQCPRELHKIPNKITYNTGNYPLTSQRISPFTMKNQSLNRSFFKDLLKQGKQSLQCMEEVVHVQFKIKLHYQIKTVQLRNLSS